MSEIYNANGTVPAVTAPPIAIASVTQAPGLSIVSSTNASPIVVTTAANTFQTGDTVEIEGHTTNTNANGLWTITVTSTTTFALNGSTGNGVGGATGYVVDYAINPLITIPDDGDAATASAFNPAYEGIFNNVPFLYERAGKYRLLHAWDVSVAGGAGIDFGTNVTLTNDSAWHDFTGRTSLMTSAFSGHAPVCKQGDILEATMSFGFHFAFGSGTITQLCLGLGSSLAGSGNLIQNSSIQDLPLNGGSSTFIFGSLVLRTIIHITSTVGLYDFGLMYLDTGTSSTNTLTLRSSFLFTCKHYRANV